MRQLPKKLQACTRSAKVSQPPLPSPLNIKLCVSQCFVCVSAAIIDLRLYDLAFIPCQVREGAS